MFKSMKNSTFIILLLVIAITYIPLGEAVGISPASVEVNFFPGDTKDLTFIIMNNAKESRNITLGFDGKLSSLVEYKQEAYAVLQSGESKRINITLHFPEKLEPGMQRITVVAKEVPFSGAVHGISVFSEVSASIDIKVPYPWDYATISLSGRDANINEPLLFTVAAENLGKRPIEHMVISLEITDSNQQPMEKLIKNVEELAPQEKKDVSFLLKTSLYQPGGYTVVAYGKYNNIIT